MKSVKLINIPTREQVEKKYQESVSDIKRHNFKCIIGFILSIIIGVFGIVTIQHCVKGPIENLWIALTAVITLLSCTISVGLFKSIRSAMDAGYRYYDIIDNYNILKAEIESTSDGYDLWLTVENSEHEVSHKWIGEFDKVTRTNIKELSVDIKEEKVYKPYEA